MKSVEAYLSLNVEDTDMMYSVYEITKDNKTIFLQQDFVRARYRNGLATHKRVPKDEIQKESRIRLMISFIDSPDFQRNFNYLGVSIVSTYRKMNILG